MLIELDLALLHARYDDALAAIDALDRHVGGDPYLEVLRVAAHANAGRAPEALATRQAADRDFPGALATLSILRQRFDDQIDPATLPDPVFAALAKSPEYAAWSKRTKQRGAHQ